MDLIRGITFNLRGLWLGLKTPKLFFLGMLRLVVVIALTILSASLILVYHQGILELIWARPESSWLLWLWHIVSWLLSLILVGVSAVISYLVSQILFSVIIMDRMSRITEFKMTGRIKEPETVSLITQFSYLIKQEIPRTTLPVLLSLILMLLGWLTPFGPVIAIISSGIMIIFLAWDSTDLLPARRLIPFKDRFKLLLKTLPFHVGFGLLFLIPLLNILLLSFAPVGATLYFLERHDGL
jgi:CysZ protein